MYNMEKRKGQGIAMDQKITNNEIKQKNRTSIFSLFRHHEQLSRQDIVTALDLSLPTVTNNLEELKKEGLIDCNKNRFELL